MAAIITNHYRIFNAKTLIESMQGASPINFMYLFIGKALAWPNADVPPDPKDNLDSRNQIWENMMSMKKVTDSDISMGIKKRLWTYGTYYDIWRHDYNGIVTGVNTLGAPTTPETLADARYYVVTENGNVYICVGNNNGMNASTDNPQTYGTGIGYEVFDTPDGYRWKYISSVSGPDYAKFSTLEFHPVKTLTTAPPPADPYEDQWNSQQTAETNGGAIYTILVTPGSGGASGYNDGDTIGTIDNQTGITVAGNGTGLKVRAHIISGGAISKIDVLDPGSGYTYCDITFSGFTTQPALTPIITPSVGLGADPVHDLNAFYMLTNVKLSYAEGDGDFTVANDYRQIGLIINPKSYGGSQLMNLSTADATTTIKVMTDVAIPADTKVVNNTNGTVGYVVDHDSTERVSRIYFPRSASKSEWTSYLGFAPGNSITYYPPGQSQVSTTIKTVGGGTLPTDPTNAEPVVTPEVQPYTGRIIYFENRRAIQRDINQVEDLHIAVEF